MQEATLQVLKTKQTPLLSTPKTPYTNSYANRSMTYPPKITTTTLALLAQPNTGTKSAYVQPRKQLTQKEIAYKRAKNLCFYCDETFVTGHKCNGQLFSLEIYADGSNSEDCELKELLDKPVTLQGVEFTSDVLILPLGGCEMVLGVQWLAIGHKKPLCNGCVGTDILKKPKLYKLTMANVFATPTSLPPKRKQDNRIPLLPNSPPINIRPYKHPPNQKDVVEAMVKELMESGVIRDSQSPYSSPIVMVKKKDGTWRMCVDYKQLNKCTVKDKFPIQVVEELLDELKGAHFFSKLDLRSDYHQIRMNEDDIEKTSIRTHEGHYEFLVMPFGLANASSTFQSLMNTVFKPFLRHFTLVFFDDILVYSATLEAHLQHLQLVLQAMRHNSLYAKMSKCIFATKQVEYLGHIISGKGVSTDPSKIKAIKPLTTLLKKNSFVWNSSAQSAFEELKLAMIQAPVMALCDFTQPFTVETDASRMGIGGSENTAADALSRISTSSELCLLILSTVTSDLL
ncbi:putative mitochondrial protein [Tanacetum coccineum]